MSDAEAFDQDLTRAMQDAKVEPVVLTSAGVATCVLMSYQHYRALTSRHAGAADPSEGVSQTPADLPPDSLKGADESGG